MRDADGRSEGPDSPLSRVAGALEDISTLLRVVAVAAAVVLVVVAFGSAVMIAFAALLAAVMLHGTAARVGRLTGIGTRWGLLVLLLLLVAFLGGLVWWRGAALAHQAALLQDALGEQLTALRVQMQQTDWGRSLYRALPFDFGTDKGVLSIPSSRIGSLFPSFVGTLWSALGLFGTVGVILVAALYMAADPAPYANGLPRLLPKRHRPRARRVLNRVGHNLWGWLVGQFLDMLIVGALSGIGLALLGVPLFLILALIAGLTNFVPYVGAIAGAVPAVLVALSVSPQAALYVALLYLGVQTVEGNVTAPLIQRYTINLPPALTLLSQVALGLVFGLLGVVLATPFTAAVLAVVQQLADEDPDY